MAEHTFLRANQDSQSARAGAAAGLLEYRGAGSVYFAGQVATDAQGKLLGGNDFSSQAEQAFRNLGLALAAIGCTPRDLAKLTMFGRDMSRIADYRAARDRFFATTNPPARPAVTFVEVSRLFADEFLIEIEAVAVAD